MIKPKHIVIELQTNEDGTVGNLVYSFDTENEAWAKFHAIMSAAATSALPCHAAVYMRSDGTFVQSGKFDNVPKSEPEVE